MSCKSYCEHGGICELEEGHAGLHDSRYCQWDDAHAITEEQADELMAKSSAGRAYLNLKSVAVDLFGDEIVL